MTALKSAESISTSTLLWNVKVVFIFLEPQKGWSFLKQKAGTSFLLREKKYLLREKLGGVGTSWSSSHGTIGYNPDKFGWWHQSPLAKGLECQRAGTGYTTHHWEAPRRRLPAGHVVLVSNSRQTGGSVGGHGLQWVSGLTRSQFQKAVPQNHEKQNTFQPLRKWRLLTAFLLCILLFFFSQPLKAWYLRVGDLSQW